jgi:hypothetical protein
MTASLTSIVAPRRNASRTSSRSHDGSRRELPAKLRRQRTHAELATTTSNLLLSAAGCVIPGRIGRTSYEDGQNSGQFTAALTKVADLGPVRAGGGPIIDVLTSDDLDLIEVGALGRADFVLYPMSKHRQAILATRLTAGIGPDSYSFSTFVGPGSALRRQHDSSTAPWHTVALGLSA